jgi:metallo-beta-lactamase family protein
VLSKRESMAIDRMVHGGIILAGSGFMDAGPVLRHLEESIDREDCTVVLSGYQPEGGFSWKLQRGADRAQFNGRTRTVRAHTVRLEGLSGHADQDDLMKWFEGFTEKPGRVLINHGVDTARQALAARLTGELGIPCTLPARDVPIEL